MRKDKELILVTGASRGIGVHICKTLVNAGYKVVGIARDVSHVAKVYPELMDNENLVFRSLDITDFEKSEEVIQEIEKSFGKVTILINNAACEYYNQFCQMDFQEVQKTINTNLLAPMKLSQILLKKCRSDQKLQIINISSLAGKVGLPFNSVYSASKAGLLLWTESLMMEYPDNVQFTSIVPGYISDTGLFYNTGMKPYHMLL